MKCHLTSRTARFIRAAAAAVGLGVAAAPALAQYDAEVGRFRAQDALDPLPQGGVVFAGSSSIRRFEQLQLDFHDYNVIQRGLGGAQFSDINKYADDIVLAYHPSAVVVWAGTNDLAAGVSGQQVVDRYQQFVQKIQTAQPNVDIFYLGITPTPGRQGNRPQEDVVNRSISQLAAGDARQHYIDLPAAFIALNPYDSPEFTSQYVDDIHLNRTGYELWTSIIRPELQAVIQPDKVYAPNPKALKAGGRLLFDFGPSNSLDGDTTPSPDANGNHWNNWFPINGGSAIIAGEHKSNLVDAAGADTGVTLTITAGYQVNGKRNGGLLNPDATRLGDLGVATATEDYFFSTADGKQGGGSDDDGGGFMLSGLDPSLAYDFDLFGSRDSTETRVTEYLITGAEALRTTLQTSGNNIGADGAYDGNDGSVVSIRGVRPDQFGQVFFDMTLLQGSFAYLNALRITAVPVPEPGVAMALPLGGALLARRVRW